jgi:hypothetical protein
MLLSLRKTSKIMSAFSLESVVDMARGSARGSMVRAILSIWIGDTHHTYATLTTTYIHIYNATIACVCAALRRLLPAICCP